MRFFQILAVAFATVAFASPEAESIAEENIAVIKLPHGCNLKTIASKFALGSAWILWACTKLIFFSLKRMCSQHRQKDETLPRCHQVPRPQPREGPELPSFREGLHEWIERLQEMCSPQVRGSGGIKGGIYSHYHVEQTWHLSTILYLHVLGPRLLQDGERGLERNMF